MKIVHGWTWIAATLVASTVWGQATPPQIAQPVAPAQGPTAPTTRNAQDATDNADNVRAPGGRRLERQPGFQGERQGAGQAQQGQWSDAQIASLLAACNRNEIEISKFAMDKLQTEEAREFASTMIKEHTPALQKLQQLAGPAMQGAGPRRAGDAANANEAPREGARGLDVGDDAADAARRPREGAVAAGGPQRRGVNWMAFHRDLADQCLNSTKEMLSEHKGIDFDKAYLGHQIVAHQEMIDKLTVAQKQVSTELQQDLQQQLTSAKQHLELAKKIMHDTKDEGARVSQKPRSQQ